MKRKYRLKNKRRFFTLIAIIIVSLILGISATTIAYGDKETSFKEVTVRSGDTLWSIAEKYNKNEDIRKYIYEIKKINNLKTSDIYAGDTLILP